MNHVLSEHNIIMQAMHGGQNECKYDKRLSGRYAKKRYGDDRVGDHAVNKPENVTRSKRGRFTEGKLFDDIFTC